MPSQVCDACGKLYGSKDVLIYFKIHLIYFKHFWELMKLYITQIISFR